MAVILLMSPVTDFLLSDIPVCWASLVCIYCMNILSRKRNLFCPQICNVIPMYGSIKCEMEEMENVAETVLDDLSQDNCAFTAPQLTVIQPIESVILICSSRH